MTKTGLPPPRDPPTSAPSRRLGGAARIDLASYRGLAPPWNDWRHLAARGRAWARTLAELLLRPEGDPE